MQKAKRDDPTNSKTVSMTPVWGKKQQQKKNKKEREKPKPQNQKSNN